MVQIHARITTYKSCEKRLDTLKGGYMKIYFQNDGTYDSRAVSIPVIMNNHPIGYVYEVTIDKVTCEIWDRYIVKEQLLYNLTTKEQPIQAIGVDNTPYVSEGRITM